MPYPKRYVDGVIMLNGTRLHWSLVRDQQWCTADGWKGPAVQVEAVEGSCRALLLQYPWKKMTTGFNSPSGVQWSRPDYQYRPRIRDVRIEADVRSAIEAGWNPQSRGKIFVHDVAEALE